MDDLVVAVLDVISSNRNVRIEGMAIIHSLIASYVAWGIIMGVWAFPGTWAKHGIHSVDQVTQWYGWVLWLGSLFVALLAWIDRDIRFDPLSDARFPARHRQLSYVLAFFGVWLIAYGGGYFHAPLGISTLITFAAIAGGMDVDVSRLRSD